MSLFVPGLVCWAPRVVVRCAAGLRQKLYTDYPVHLLHRHADTVNDPSRGLNVRHSLNINCEIKLIVVSGHVHAASAHKSTARNTTYLGRSSLSGQHRQIVLRGAAARQ